MALTRPKLWDIDTTITSFLDPITVLHQGSTLANVDVGFLINRSNGLTGNAAIYWSENLMSFLLSLTNDSGVPVGYANVNASSYANLTVDVLYANSLQFNTGSAFYGNPYVAGLYLGQIRANTQATLIDTLPLTGNTLVNWKISAKDNINNRYKATTIDSVNDGANVYYTEYATIRSNNSFNIATFTSNISNGNVNLWATGDSSNVTIAFERVAVGSGTVNGYLGATGPIGPQGAITGTASNIVTTSANNAASIGTGALQVASGGASIGLDLWIGGNIVQTGTGFAKIPSGTSTQRPAVPSTGMIRYNTTLQSYEGYGAGAAWSSLGGVKSVSGNAYVAAELSAGSGDDVLRFYSGSTGSSQQVAYMSGSNVSILTTQEATSTTTGALRVAGGVGIAGNLYVGGNLVVSNISYTYQEIITTVETVQGNLTVNSTAQSTSTSTGALIVAGGAGFSGNVNIAGTVTAANFAYSSSEQVDFVYTLDDLSYQFNGFNTAFTLTYNDGTAISPANPYNVQIYIGGVPIAPAQYIADYHNLPEVSVFSCGFTITGNTITFASAPSPTMTFYGTVRNNSAPTTAFAYKQTPFSALNIMLGP